jgi:hypothetical protein
MVSQSNDGDPHGKPPASIPSSARPDVRLTLPVWRRVPAHGRIFDDGRMEWTFTGEVIECRGPAPYQFVTMTPAQSQDLNEAARGLSY